MPQSAKRPLVIVTRKLPDVVETRMRELFDARLNVDDRPMTQAELVTAAQTADVLVPTVTDRIDKAVLAQSGPGLKLIANFGTGVDNIDLDTARNRGITVTNTPGVLTEDTADMTMALILAAPRRLAQGTAYLKDPRNHWAGWSPWEQLDPAMQRTHSGAARGVGAKYAWEGNRKVGQGSMAIVESTPPLRLAVQLDFIKPFEGHNVAEFALAPSGSATTVIWAMYGPSPLVMRVMGLFVSMDQMMGKDFEAGLASLKAVVEG